MILIMRGIVSGHGVNHDPLRVVYYSLFLICGVHPELWVGKRNKVRFELAASFVPQRRAVE